MILKLHVSRVAYLVLMDSRDKHAGGIKSLTNSVRVVSDIGSAAAVNREDWVAKTARPIRIKVGDNNASVDVTVAVAVPVEGAIAKHQNQAFEIGAAPVSAGAYLL